MSSSSGRAIVSVHRLHAVSGINAWGRRMSAHRDARWSTWRILFVGELGSVDDHDLPPDAHRALWPAHASPTDQVRAVRDALRSLAPRIVLANDSPHAYIAGALEESLTVVGLCHTSHEEDEDLYSRVGPLARSWGVVSRAASDRFARFLDHQPRVIPCGLGVPKSPSPLAWPIAPLRLLYAGRLDKHCKRALDLARLADELHRLGCDFTLTIAGDGSARRELEVAIELHARRGRAALLGIVPPEHMDDLIDQHDALVLVSAFEGSPVTVHEAMARGRCVAITTGCGGALDLVRDGREGLVVNVGDMGRLAARLSALTREDLVRMGRAAHARALELLDLPVICNGYANLFDLALAAPPVENRRLARAIAQAVALVGDSSPNEVRRLWAESRVEPVDERDCAADPVINLASRRLLRVADQLAREGVRAMVLFGAGQHTTRLQAGLARVRAPRCAAVLDDRAAPGATILGLPVVPPEEFAKLDAQAVVISSDEHQDLLARRARAACPGARVVLLYPEFSGEPAGSSALPVAAA